jgi:ubiquinone/menaquinone biosynthesis C-methylase UbiE
MSVPRYDYFGREYDIITSLNQPESEIEWYLSYAKQCGSPILDLMCGSCRVAISLIEAGFVVTGIDLSAKMLDIAREKMMKIDPRAAGRLTLYHGDVNSISISGEYNMAFMANNSFRYLRSKANQIAFLSRIRSHLKGGARFLLVESTDWIKNRFKGIKDTGWTRPVYDQDRQAYIKKRIQTEFNPAQKKVKVHYTFEVSYLEGKRFTKEIAETFPLLDLEDYKGIFNQIGMKIESISGDYLGTPFGPKSELICIVALNPPKSRG